jgi:hypothetical protein
MCKDALQDSVNSLKKLCTDAADHFFDKEFSICAVNVSFTCTPLSSKLVEIANFPARVDFRQLCVELCAAAGSLKNNFATTIIENHIQDTILLPHNAMATPLLELDENIVTVKDSFRRCVCRCGACLSSAKEKYYLEAVNHYPWLSVGWQHVGVPPEAAVCADCLAASKSVVYNAVLEDIKLDRKTLLRQVITRAIYPVEMRHKRSKKFDAEQLFAHVSRGLILYHQCAIDDIVTLFPGVSALIDRYLTPWVNSTDNVSHVANSEKKKF